MAYQFFNIISKKSGKLLDQGGSSADSASVVQYVKTGSDNQKWRLEPEISDVLKNETTNSLDFAGTVLTSTVNGVSATIDIASILADVLYIQTGEVTHGYENAGWTLRSGEGERTFTAKVKFNSPFRVPPQVSLAISGQDIGIQKNIRLQVVAKNITVDGFELTYRTWFNTEIFTAWVTWTAIGVKP